MGEIHLQARIAELELFLKRKSDFENYLLLKIYYFMKLLALIIIEFEFVLTENLNVGEP